MFVSHFFYTIVVVKLLHSQEMKGIKEVVIPCRLEGAAGICCRYCVLHLYLLCFFGIAGDGGRELRMKKIKRAKVLLLEEITERRLQRLVEIS